MLPVPRISFPDHHGGKFLFSAPTRDMGKGEAMDGPGSFPVGGAISGIGVADVARNAPGQRGDQPTTRHGAACGPRGLARLAAGGGGRATHGRPAQCVSGGPATITARRRGGVGRALSGTQGRRGQLRRDHTNHGSCAEDWGPFSPASAFTVPLAANPGWNPELSQARSGPAGGTASPRSCLSETGERAGSRTAGVPAQAARSSLRDPGQHQPQHERGQRPRSQESPTITLWMTPNWHN